MNYIVDVTHSFIAFPIKEATPPPPSSAPSSAQEENAPPKAGKLSTFETDDVNPFDEELAVKRLPATTLQVWGSLLGRRGYEVSDGQLIRSPKKARPAPAAIEVPDSPVGNGSLINQFRRANSFAPARSESASSRAQPFRRTKTTLGVDLSTKEDDPAEPEPKKFGESSNSASGAVTHAASSTNIFGGARFIVLGEAKSASVRAAIEENGGRMVNSSAEDDVDFIIVRLVRQVLSNARAEKGFHFDTLILLAEVNCTAKSPMDWSLPNTGRNVGWRDVFLKRGYVHQKTT